MYDSCSHTTDHHSINANIEDRDVRDSLPCNNSLLDVFQHAAVEVVNWY